MPGKAAPESRNVARVLRHGGAQPADTQRHQQDVQPRAHADDSRDMLAAQALAQHKCVLCPDRHDEPEAQSQALHEYGGDG